MVICGAERWVIGIGRCNASNSLPSGTNVVLEDDVKLAADRSWR
jgi:hypothetical protein